MQLATGSWLITMIAAVVGCSSASPPLAPVEARAPATIVARIDAGPPIDADPLDQPLDLGDPWDDGNGRYPIAKMMSFVNRMCACRDRACADVVQGDMSAWADEMAMKAPPAAAPSTDPQSPSDRDKVPPKVMRRMEMIGQRYAECMTRAMEH